MKRFLIVLFFLLLHFRLSAQQFSQYNTGTLYDTFENPSQKAFIPDSSRKYAFNLFMPNFGTDLTLTGDVQAALKNRAFLGHYNDNDLSLGKQKFNYINTNFNAYFFMLRFYSGTNGNQEFGISAQTRYEGRGNFSDESVEILANNARFTKPSYSDLFNTKFNYQLYHQIGISYRTDVDDQLSVGFKLSALMGVVANKVNINHSIINFDRPHDQAFLSVSGNYAASFEPGKFTTHDLLPSFKNPGASISLGTSFITDDKTHIQFNVKDLGFIHWSSLSVVGEFNNTGIIRGLSQRGVEDSIANTAAALVQSRGVEHSFTTPTDSRMELSASKSYWINGSAIKYSPTAILSKQLFYTGFTGALVNHFQYQNLVGTLTGSYDDMHLFSLGAQFMVKSPNGEFFIGSDRIGQTASLIRSATYGPSGQTNTNASYTGANFYIGFSIKFGPYAESRYNTSNVPMGDKRNFATRFWQRITGKEY
ncbi:MAG: DUF5723 family protein [Bacteroidota bacterium]